MIQEADQDSHYLFCPAGTVRTMYVHCTYSWYNVRTLYVHCTYSARWVFIIFADTTGQCLGSN